MAWGSDEDGGATLARTMREAELDAQLKEEPPSLPP